tara:strand:- start:456 stop:878 length:423 start_codon:yes stop_codon:yes gene_type:complete
LKRKFKILNVDHVAVATEEINKLKHVLVDILGMSSSSKEYVINELVDVVKIFSKSNQTAIELLESSSPASAVATYVDKKGPGIHHIALTVDSIENAIIYLKNNNIDLVYEKPKIGSDNKLITFIHPKSTPGLLIELCQKK